MYKFSAISPDKFVSLFTICIEYISLNWVQLGQAPFGWIMRGGGSRHFHLEAARESNCVIGKQLDYKHKVK